MRRARLVVVSSIAVYGDGLDVTWRRFSDDMARLAGMPPPPAYLLQAMRELACTNEDPARFVPTREPALPFLEGLDGSAPNSAGCCASATSRRWRGCVSKCLAAPQPGLARPGGPAAWRSIGIGSPSGRHRDRRRACQGAYSRMHALYADAGVGVRCDPPETPIGGWRCAALRGLWSATGRETLPARNSAMNPTLPCVASRCRPESLCRCCPRPHRRGGCGPGAGRPGSTGCL